MKRRCVWSVALMVLLWSAAVPAAAAVDWDDDLVRIEILPGDLSLLVNDLVQLEAQGVTSGGQIVPVDVTWSCDDPSVQVSSIGVVVGQAQGVAVVEAVEPDSGLTDAIEVKVGYDILILNTLDGYPSISLFDSLQEFLVPDAGLPDWPSPNGIEVRGEEALVVISGGWSPDPEYAIKVFDTKTMKLKRSVDLAGSADNPWDLALLDEHKAYVSGYNSDTIAVIDPSTGFVLETIPLPPADLFGLPSLNPAGMDIAEGRVFFACNAYDYISGAGEGMVFVVDTTTDELIDVDPSTPESVDPIRMNQFNTQDVALADSGYLFAVSVGNYWSEWSVVDVIDPAVLQLAVPDGIALGDGASATSVSPAPNGKVYFSDGMNPHIYSVDDATFEPLRTMSFGDFIVVPHDPDAGYWMPSKLGFRDGIAHGLEFNSDYYFQFDLAADDDTNPISFLTEVALYTDPTQHPGTQCLDFVQPTNQVYQTIELVLFDAEAQGRNVTITWATEAEPDNAGFRLWRSESQSGPYEAIHDGLIPGEGDQTHGAYYEFEDRRLAWETAYHYKLEDVSVHGIVAFHGPVEVTTEGLSLCGFASGSGSAWDLVALVLILFSALAAMRIGAMRSMR